jgi:hypothetical protein
LQEKKDMLKRLSTAEFARAALWTAAALLAGRLYAQAPADVAGEWDVTVNSPQGTNQALLTLKREGEAWTGTFKGARGERPLQNVTLKGNEIRFEMKVTLQGNEAVFVYSGAVDKAGIKGTADFGGFATGDWSAVRHAASASAAAAPAPAAGAAPAAAATGVDVTGTWVFNVQTDQGSGQPTFTFKQDGQKLTGTYSGAFGSANVVGTLKGSEISFSFTADAGGQSAEISYTGKLVGQDSMEGTVKLGGFGDGAWTGKRSK